jgi:hypothetical protein
VVDPRLKAKLIERVRPPRVLSDWEREQAIVVEALAKIPAIVDGNAPYARYASILQASPALLGTVGAAKQLVEMLIAAGIDAQNDHGNVLVHVASLRSAAAAARAEDEAAYRQMMEAR